MEFPGSSDGKESSCNAGDLGLIPRLGRSPGEGNATYSSILAWRIPWTEEPGGLYSPWGHKESDMTEWLIFSLSCENELSLYVCVNYIYIVVIQSLSHVQHFETPWTGARQTSLFFTISQSLLKLTSNVSVMPSNHLILCCPFLLLPLIFPSIRVFSNESALHIRLPKYWSFHFNISLAKEYSGLISFRTD